MSKKVNLAEVKKKDKELRKLEQELRQVWVVLFCFTSLDK